MLVSGSIIGCNKADCVVSYRTFLTADKFLLTAEAPSHCTLAVTVALPVSVKVQVLVLLPPLEQAPDHMASRPLETVSAIAVPVVNGAEPVLPTATLIPAGLEVTLFPLLPDAVTVSVAV